MKATVKYQIATYSGTVDVFCDENDCNDDIYALAEQELIRKSRGCGLPYGYKYYKIISRS